MDIETPRMIEIVRELEQLRASVRTMQTLDKNLRTEFADILGYKEAQTATASTWVGNKTISLSRPIARKVDEKALAVLLEASPELAAAFVAKHTLNAKRYNSAGPVYGPLIDSVMTETPGALALKITERKEEEE